jgi:hypothetical protein
VKELLADLVDNLRHHGVRAAYFSTGERCDDTVGALLHMASDSYLGDGDFTEYETAISPRPWVRVPRCPYADLLEAVHGYHDALWDYRRDQFCLAIAALLQDQPLALVRYQYGIGHHNEVNDNTRDLDTFSRHQEEVHLVMLDDDGKLPPPPRPLSGYWRDGHLLTVGYLFTWREKLVKRY